MLLDHFYSKKFGYLGLVFVTYCSKSKTNIKSGTPRELYNSQRIKSFFNRFPRKRYILSHKHGVVYEDQQIDNYELNHFVNYKKCVKTVNQLLGTKKVLFYSPRALVEKTWRKLLDDAKINYIVIRSYKKLPNLNLHKKIERKFKLYNLNKIEIIFFIVLTLLLIIPYSAFKTLLTSSPNNYNSNYDSYVSFQLSYIVGLFIMLGLIWFFIIYDIRCLRKKPDFRVSYEELNSFYKLQLENELTTNELSNKMLEYYTKYNY